jgi:hypothetical protein
MSVSQKGLYQPWPELPYEAFKSTSHILHMLTQAIGKLKLLTPFEPQWGNVILFLTSRGLTTGPIPFAKGAFAIDIDLIKHQVICSSSWDSTRKLKLSSTPVAHLINSLLKILHRMGIDQKINLKPQEIPNPIPFDQDEEYRIYDPELANAWWRALLSSYLVMQTYHAKFLGKTQPLGLMWGTFDLRDVRFNGDRIQPTGINAGYLRRNAMDAAQIEAGWWSGNAAYPRPAYYSFTYPQPAGIEDAKIKPDAARWDKDMFEFILDYDDIRQTKHPEKELLAFLESTYQVGSELAGWDKGLLGSGKPF